MDGVGGGIGVVGIVGGFFFWVGCWIIIFFKEFLVMLVLFLELDMEVWGECLDLGVDL